jgi:hypothetical protein
MRIENSSKFTNRFAEIKLEIQYMVGHIAAGLSG